MDRDLQNFVRGQVSSDDLLKVIPTEILKEASNCIADLIEKEGYTVHNVELKETNKSGNISFRVVGEAYVDLNISTNRMVAHIAKEEGRSCNFDIEFVENYKEISEKIIQKLG